MTSPCHTNLSFVLFTKIIKLCKIIAEPEFFNAKLLCSLLYLPGGKLSAGSINIFPFAAAYVDHHIAILEIFHEFVAPFVRAMLKPRAFDVVLFDEVDFNGELPAI